MKKITLLSLTLVAFLTSYAQSRNEQLRNELARIEEKMQHSDTTGVREALKNISKQCESSNNWRISFDYYKNFGLLEAIYRKDYASSIPYMLKAYNAYPTNVAVDGDFNIVSSVLVAAYVDQKQYDNVEPVAADALIRGASINDSLPGSIDLFTCLAESYEQRGDTIMPPHFHRKSQELAILYQTRQTQPDSVERIHNRLLMRYAALEQERPFFTRQHPGYLMLQSEYLGWVAESGNIAETIWLGEKILKIARDSALDTEPWIIDTYFGLIYAYAGDDKMDRCEALIPIAKKCYAAYVDDPEKDGVIYYHIGNGLMDNQHFEEAIPYFKRSLKRMAKEDLNYYKQDIEARVAFCNEKKGFGKK